MFRRSFLQRLTMAGATGMAGISGATAKSVTTVVYMVKGFSCPTCAVGLDTILSKVDGVLKSASTYPEGKVTIDFDSSKASTASLKALILEQGFTIGATVKG